MTKPSIKIRLATINDTEQLTDFRISQFKTAKEFEIKSLDTFSRQSGTTIIAEIQGEIISTMQAEIVTNLTDLENRVDATIAKDAVNFDTFYLSKGATSKEFRNTGLNSFLRLLIIEQALKINSIQTLSGIAYDNAPRIRILKKLNYSFTEVTEWESSPTIGIGKVFLITLPRTSFYSALLILKSEITDLFSQYNFEKIN